MTAIAQGFNAADGREDGAVRTFFDAIAGYALLFHLPVDGGATGIAHAGIHIQPMQRQYKRGRYHGLVAGTGGGHCYKPVAP